MAAGSLLLSTVVVAAGTPPALPPPPLPSAVTPGGTQPVMPPPSIPLPETNLDLNVPPVYERPLGAEEGARVFVKKFVITGVVGDRKAGISPAEIQSAVDERFADIEKLVEQERLKKQNLEKQGPEGFTPDEQDKIIKFMSGAVKTQSPDEQQKQYQQFIQELMLERLQRLQGLTIGQLQQMADVVTKYYHDKGYFLARAVIPAQEIKDGVVNIRVLEGRLEKVVPSGNKRYSDSTLAAPFKPLIGDLVTVDRTENALLTMNQYPGLSAAGVFRPGNDVGTTDIVVNVQNEKPYDANARFDNDGTRFTGRNRLIGTFDWNNPFGDADVLDVTALKTYSPSEAKFGDIRYEHPFFSAYDRWAVDVSRNSFDVASGGSITLNGTPLFGGVSKIALFSVQHDFERSREEKVVGTVDFSRKRADTLFTGAVATGGVANRDDLAVLGAQLNYDSINSNANTISSSVIRLDHGFAGLFGVPSAAAVATLSPPPQRQGVDANGHKVIAVPDFNRLTASYQIYKNLPDNQGLLFRVSGQYSPQMLSSLEAMVIGGPDTVRAVPTSQFLRDKGGFGSLEYSVRAPGFSDKHAFGSYTWGQVLRFRVFEDAAVGFNNDVPPGQTNRVEAAGLGFGVEFTIPGSFTANLQWARLNGGARPGQGANDPNAIPNSSETWFDLTYTF